MQKKQKKLTLDKTAIYEIVLPGMIDNELLDHDQVSIRYGETDDQIESILTYSTDQAGLHGLLRKIYSLGIPVISVTCMDNEEQRK